MKNFEKWEQEMDEFYQKVIPIIEKEVKQNLEATLKDKPANIIREFIKSLDKETEVKILRNILHELGSQHPLPPDEFS